MIMKKKRELPSPAFPVFFYIKLIQLLYFEKIIAAFCPPKPKELEVMWLRLSSLKVSVITFKLISYPG